MEKKKNARADLTDADPLQAAAAATIPVTGKRKREADAEVTEKTTGGEMGGSGIDNEGKGKEKKKRKISAAVWKTMTRGQRKNHMKNRNRRDAS